MVYKTQWNLQGVLGEGCVSSQPENKDGADLLLTAKEERTEAARQTEPFNSYPASTLSSKANDLCAKMKRAWSLR